MMMSKYLGTVYVDFSSDKLFTLDRTGGKKLTKVLRGLQNKYSFYFAPPHVKYKHMELYYKVETATGYWFDVVYFGYSQDMSRIRQVASTPEQVIEQVTPYLAR